MTSTLKKALMLSILFQYRRSLFYLFYFFLNLELSYYELEIYYKFKNIKIKFLEY